MSQVSDKTIADLYLSGMSIAQVCEQSGAPERLVKITIKQLGIARSRSESIAIAKQRQNLMMSKLDKLEQKEAAPCYRAHQLLSLANHHITLNAQR